MECFDMPNWTISMYSAVQKRDPHKTHNLKWEKYLAVVFEVIKKVLIWSVAFLAEW